MDIIVDIDGTVADLQHRLHFIQGEKKNWDAFFDACGKDAPIKPVCELIGHLIEGGATIIFASGRSDRVREATLAWLERFNPTMQPYAFNLYMRKDGDHRPDHLVKREMLARIRKDGFNPMLAIDDRKQVVDMWRAEGLICAQVAEGEF